MNKALKLFLPVFFFLMPFSIFAQNQKPFELSPVKDGIIFGSGVLLSGGDLLLDNVLEINRQEYNGKIYKKKTLNSFDKTFMHSYSKTRDDAADFLLVATMATPAVLLMTDTEEWFTCATMYAETLLIANGIKEITKLCVTRPRPYMYYDPESFPKDDIEEGDWANSFPSGHSTIAFSSATFASYTFCKYFPESKLKIPVIAGSYGMAVGVAALRVLSGNHFMTDVLTGAAIGSLTGLIVPWLHTFNSKHEIKISLLQNGFSLRL